MGSVGNTGVYSVNTAIGEKRPREPEQQSRTNALALLPLIIRDVRSVLERARANPERVDAIVAQTRAADS